MRGRAASLGDFTCPRCSHSEGGTRESSLAVIGGIAVNARAKLSSFIYDLINERHHRILLAAVLLFSTLLSSGLVFTRRPFCDEAWFASPPYNLLHHGHMGMTILDPHGFVFASLVQDIDKYTYWVMPGYLLAQTAWYWVFGFSLFAMRFLSVIFGAAALMAWYVIVRWLSGKRSVALLAVFLLGIEDHFSLSAAMGRMDMMCASLSLMGVASYLLLRERSLRLALGVSCGILAVSLFTHPNAVMGLGALAGFVLWLDARRLKLADVAVAASPFLVCAGLWGLYILKDPGAFTSQMQAQAAIPHRFDLPVNPLASIRREVELRYAPRYGFATQSPLALMRIVLIGYFAAVMAALVLPGLRKLRSARALLLLLALNFGVLMCLQKNFYYLIYILPCYAALLAVTANWLWNEPLFRGWRVPRWATALAIAGIAALNIGVTSSRLLHNEYAARFVPAIEKIKENLSPGDRVIGSGELAFGLGFDGTVIDDARLGLTSGKKPEFVVIEAFYGIMWRNWFTVHEPATAEHIKNLLATRFEVILDQAKDDYPTYGLLDYPYKVYQRTTGESTED